MENIKNVLPMNRFHVTLCKNGKLRTFKNNFSTSIYQYIVEIFYQLP